MFVVCRYWSNSLAEINARLLANIRLNPFGCYALLPEVSVKPTQDSQPFSVVVDNVADGASNKLIASLARRCWATTFVLPALKSLSAYLSCRHWLTLEQQFLGDC